MKYLFFSILCTFLAFSAVAQNAESILTKMEFREIKDYDFSKSFSEQIILKMPFGKNNFLNETDIALVGRVTVTKIELVYSNCPQPVTFDSEKQKSLNLQRLKILESKIPDIFKNDAVKWELVAQTGCATSKEARDLFHGFVIHYTIPKK
jgi:DNA-directed RNA polymerase subunit H (RpoH/RPB5)